VHPVAVEIRRRTIKTMRTIWILHDIRGCLLHSMA
jgi:hypothetical protein